MLRVDERLPENVYLHGRAGLKSLTGSICFQCSKEWDVARQYAHHNGSVWAIEIVSSSKVMDMTLEANRLAVIAQLKSDYENGNCSHDLDSLLKFFEDEDWEELADGLNPEQIVQAAEAWDNWDIVEWFCENHDVDIVITEDGAVLLNAQGVETAEITELAFEDYEQY